MFWSFPCHDMGNVGTITFSFLQHLSTLELLCMHSVSSFCDNLQRLALHIFLCSLVSGDIFLSSTSMWMTFLKLFLSFYNSHRFTMKLLRLEGKVVVNNPPHNPNRRNEVATVSGHSEPVLNN